MSICGSIVLEEVLTGLSVPADLLDRITQANLNDWQREWLPAMSGLLRNMHATGACAVYASSDDPLGLGTKSPAC